MTDGRTDGHLRQKNTLFFLRKMGITRNVSLGHGQHVDYKSFYAVDLVCHKHNRQDVMAAQKQKGLGKTIYFSMGDLDLGLT